MEGLHHAKILLLLFIVFRTYLKFDDVDAESNYAF